MGGEKFTIVQMVKMSVTKHALNRFVARLRCPAPKDPEGLMKRFLGQAIEVEEAARLDPRAEGRFFQAPNSWVFVLNEDLTRVITCVRYRGRGAGRFKPRYRHQRARENRKWRGKWEL